MDWLGKSKAITECREQRIVLRGPNGENVSYIRNPKSPTSNIIYINIGTWKVSVERM